MIFPDAFPRPFHVVTMQDTASGVALWRQVADGIERGIADGGSGTYVEAPRLPYPLSSRTRFSEIVGAGGREPRGQLIGASEEPAARELARHLDLKAGALLVRIEALRLADRTPIRVGTTWLSAERFPEAGRIYESARSMTKVLAHYGVRDYRRASTHVTAAIVDATDAARLDLGLGRPILVVENTDVDAEGKPLPATRARCGAK